MNSTSFGSKIWLLSSVRDRLESGPKLPHCSENFDCNNFALSFPLTCFSTSLLFPHPSFYHASVQVPHSGQAEADALLQGIKSKIALREKEVALMRADQESIWLLYLSAMKPRWSQANPPFPSLFSS